MMSGKTTTPGMKAIHADSIMGWELFGRGAIRSGEFKLVHIEVEKGGRDDDGWELFDISKDPGEIEDLADAQPGKVKEMLKLWDQYVAETGVVWGTPIRSVGQEWDGNDESIIGGDHITQTKAWMAVTKNRAPIS